MHYNNNLQLIGLTFLFFPITIVPKLLLINVIIKKIWKQPNQYKLVTMFHKTCHPQLFVRNLTRICVKS